MDLEERVYSVLVVSAARSFNASLLSVLPEGKFSPIRLESSVTSARQTILERAFDFVVINSPLPDETGIRFSIDVCSEKNTIALLLIKAEEYADVYSRVSGYGVYTLAKPTSRIMVSQAIDWMIATRERLKKLERRKLSLEEKMQEIRIVNRAKWVLIDQLKMNESDAHRFIEKQAMDRCISRREVAESILAASR